MKWIVNAAAILALSVSLAGLGGCSAGPSAMELIEENVKSELDLITSDPTALADGIAESMGQELDALGVDAEAFSEAYFEGYEYTIDMVNVDEDAGTAIVTVSMTCKPMVAVVERFKMLFTEKVNSVDLNDMTQDDLYKLGGKMLMDAVKSVEPTETNIHLYYSKDEDGDWKASDKAVQELTNALKGSVEPEDGAE